MQREDTAHAPIPKQRAHLPKVGRHLLAQRQAHGRRRRCSGLRCGCLRCSRLRYHCSHRGPWGGCHNKRGGVGGDISAGRGSAGVDARVSGSGGDSRHGHRGPRLRQHQVAVESGAQQRAAYKVKGRGKAVGVRDVAADAGADVLNVPDTVGYTSPEEMYELFRDLCANIKRQDHVVFSTHCHNDLGMAVANSLAAVRGGAGQIECSINGIGERAGNCALEEVVMAIKTRADHYRADTGIRTQGLYAASGLLAESTGNAPPRNKAVVGRNAFAHEAGIHQHGMLANRETYEIMEPSDVGVPSTLVLGKHSGKHALRARLEGLGYDIGDNRMETVFAQFKTLADTKREVTDNDLVALIEGEDVANIWHLVRAELRTGTKATANPTAKLVVDHRDRGRLSAIGHGTGPFEALSDAFCIVAEVEGTLDSIDAHQLSREMDIEVGLTVAGEKVRGRSQHTDVIVAAAEALLAAFNNHARKTNAAQQSAAEEAPVA